MSRAGGNLPQKGGRAMEHTSFDCGEAPGGGDVLGAEEG